MAREYRIVSGDSHVNPPMTFWRDYLPKEFADVAPRVEREEDADYIVFEGKRTRHSMMGALAGRKPEEYDPKGHADDALPGGWDPAPCIVDMDYDGVDAEVLYGGGPLGSRDLDLHLASFRAYNDWLGDFCSYAPDRLFGIAYVPLLDVQRGIEETAHAKERGLRGVVINAHPPVVEDIQETGGLGLIGDPTRSFTEPEFGPFFDASIDLDMPLHMHLGARRSPASTPGSWMRNMVMTKFSMAEPVADFIFGGILAERPELKLVSVESGVGWMAFAIEYMDHLFEKHKFWTQSPLTEPPSFYFHRQIFGTFLHDPAGVRERAAIGVNNIMWSSDYPHSETTWPKSKESIAKHFAGVPDDETFRITCQNAVELYGMNES